MLLQRSYKFLKFGCATYILRQATKTKCELLSPSSHPFLSYGVEHLSEKVLLTFDLLDLKCHHFIIESYQLLVWNFIITSLRILDLWPKICFVITQWHWASFTNMCADMFLLWAQNKCLHKITIRFMISVYWLTLFLPLRMFVNQNHSRFDRLMPSICNQYIDTPLFAYLRTSIWCTMKTGWGEVRRKVAKMSCRR